MGSQVLQWNACEGRNTWDHPLAVPSDMGTEALNMSLNSGQLGSKRPGAPVVTLAGGTVTGVRYLAKFLATGDDASAQLMLLTAQSPPEILRVTTGNTAVLLGLAFNVANVDIVSSATLNGKWFIAYSNGTNRLQVYDPSTSTTNIRPVGLALPGAATVANAGSGSYAAVQRWYQVQWRVESGGVILRQSNLGTSVAFTPSGSGTAARITQPTPAGEGETHWAIYASADSVNGPFYRIADVAIGTTTFDDTNITTTYDTFPIGPLVGESFPFPSVKFVLSDGIRLFGLGVWQTTAGDSVAPISGRVYFTPPLGTSDTGDDERTQDTVSQSDWIDLSINANSQDVGLAGPLNNNIFAFQSRGIYQLVPTGNAQTPYRRVVLSKVHGAVTHQSLVMGEDESGAASIYFLDPQDGPRRIRVGAGIQWLGKDVEDVWKTVNLAANKPAFGVYDAPNKQVKWWVSTAGVYPDTMIVYHVTLGRIVATDLRYGWSKWTGKLATASTAVMFPATLATTRPYLNVPYAWEVNDDVLMRQDGTSNQDAGSSYQAYVQSKAWDVEPLARRKRITECYVAAKVQANTSISHALIKDWGAETMTDTVSLAALGAETRVRPRAQGNSDMANAITIQTQIGDAAAANTTWTLDRWQALIEVQEGAK